MRHRLDDFSQPPRKRRDSSISRLRLREQLQSGSLTLALLASSQFPELANAQEPQSPIAAPQAKTVRSILPKAKPKAQPEPESEPDPIADARRIADNAEAVLNEQDQLRKEEQAQQLIRDAGALPPGEAKTSLLKRLARIFASDSATTSNARKAALTIDPAAASEQARTLVLLAKAELASGQSQQAWWTLHEAQ